MIQKVIFITKNKLRFISNNELILKCLDKNNLISSLAIEELVQRNPLVLETDLNLLKQVIRKMQEEQIFKLATGPLKSQLNLLAYQRACEILEYYEFMNQLDFLNKCNENNKIYRL